MSDGIAETEIRKNDLNDELDYEEEENQLSALQNNNNISNTKKQLDTAVDEDSDGEIKSDNQDDLDEGEVPSPKKEINDEVDDDDGKKSPDQNKEEKHSEEEGEINDGEKVKKAFIPRVLCKYYQRGKCTWGRTCKFLHPGVNDTGSYTFLEYQDPSAALQQKGVENLENDSSKQEVQSSEIPQTESAWERGLRIAKEMKEKALKRKQMEKDQFDDKKMNLSLKEFENEKENDERYVNIEMSNNVDDDLDDEELNLFANNGRVRSIEKNVNRTDFPTNTRFESSFDPRRSGGHNDQRSRPKNNRNMPNRDSNRSRTDEWHDPWERSQPKNKISTNRRDRSKSYSSSDSNSRSPSRSRSRSKSSNSSKSSYSYSSRSSSRSVSRSPSSKRDKQNRGKSSNSNKEVGRQISDQSLKKSNNDLKGKTKSSKMRSDSSASSYSSSSEENDSKSESESETHSDEDDNKRKNKSRVAVKGSLKRAADDLKNIIESKKSKTSSSPTSNKQTTKTTDKKQLIKDQLKLLESALNKKKQMNK